MTHYYRVEFRIAGTGKVNSISVPVSKDEYWLDKVYELLNAYQHIDMLHVSREVY